MESPGRLDAVSSAWGRQWCSKWCASVCASPTAPGAGRPALDRELKGPLPFSTPAGGRRRRHQRAGCYRARPGARGARPD